MTVLSLERERAAVPVTETLAPITSYPFQAYVDQHRLSWLAVAREAGVRCITVWNIAHGIAVSGAQAMRVRVAAHRLSGVAYTGPMQTEAGQVQEMHATKTLSTQEEVLP